MRKNMELILQAAKSHLEDLQSGLDDGTYDEGEQFAQDLEQAIDELENPKRRYPQEVCSHCGSQNIKVDAYAEQNPQTGEWELAQTFDDAYCEDCEGECSTKQMLDGVEVWPRSLFFIYPELRPEDKALIDECNRLYHEQGPSAVYDKMNGRTRVVHTKCKGCEAETPTFVTPEGDSCALCGASKERRDYYPYKT